MGHGEFTADFCSFCAKSQKQVRKMIAGPDVAICDECVDLCVEIIEEELSGWREPVPEHGVSACAFCNSPVEEGPLVVRLIAGEIRRATPGEIGICEGCATFVVSVHEELDKPESERKGPLPVVGATPSAPRNKGSGLNG